MFHRFLVEEAVPLVDRTYRTTRDRTIRGHSLAGLMPTYALLQSTNTFQKFILASPTMIWDDGKLLRDEMSQPPVEDC